MTGKVFISCGQRLSVEKEAAGIVYKILKYEFHLEPYKAIDIQSIDELMVI
jgi:hypothetical protein